MTKIRVYELAKEAEMENKDLVAALIEMGYAIKSHSSTLEDEIAQEIRQRLGIGQTRTEEKRIQGAGKTTIIRRRTKTVPVEVPPVEELPVKPRPAAVSQEEGEEVGETVQPVEISAESVEEVVRETVAEAKLPAEAKGETEVEPEVSVPSAEEEPEGAMVGSAVAHPEEEEVSGVEAVEEKVEEQAPVVDENHRKGFARVIKRSAIVIAPSAPSRPFTPRPKRVEPVKGRPVVAQAPAAKDEGEKSDALKGKKGKRFVKFTTETAEHDRTKKTPLRSQRQADIDIEDVDDALGGKIPAGLRVGRTLRSGGKKGKRQIVSQQASETKAIKKRIKVLETITVGDLAHRMGLKVGELIAKLLGMGVMATINQALDVDTATLVASDFGYEVEQGVTEEQTIINLEEQEGGGEMLPRPPVVTVMGHVDHGKTSVLDAIRKTDVATGEAGGITQHIGAHYVRSPQGDVVFLDTPGHAAFTEMRSRGAQVTDLVVLVVAADDGVMDQTREAVNHARAANVPILVCVNKIDKPDADPMRVKRELADLNLVSEEWGGDTIFCETSAKTGKGIPELLESIHLQAEFLELKADPNRRAKGHVIEAQLHKGRGPVATVLIEQGTLRLGDACVAGIFYGKVRSLTNDRGESVKEAGPATPVEVQGLSGVPRAGDEFVVLPDEKRARSVSADRQLKSREAELGTTTKISLENLFDKLQEGNVKELRVALRADVQGTLEAFSKAIEDLATDEVKVRILHAGTGTITDSDVLLSAASDAFIIGFNVRPSAKVQELAKNEKVDIRTYDVIYHALDDIKKAMVGLLDARYEEKILGAAEVRETYQVPKVGTIAGCYVTDGKIERNAKVRVVREGVVIFTGQLASLRRFKDDVKDVQSGYECGIGVANYNDLKLGDVLEFFVLKEVEREL
ncbi:translation initiation factor IF-2 [Thiovibrio frasassiensis]|jgi:translation initiation factor IF-2|uniref:Translation initiation factor IF-2 n=1 Tax=Thiovibrio frasassiensis TaxID=2984131 RepID=A0A9X4MG19_9BACT|nr:translation initiation factor IF-2 [Thiovibrio frasassiensis]MDG4474883.1 translation initiation factor IF-2 [Thiovibrio frasassiensis]